MGSRSPRAAFIVVDMQEDFCMPHGSLGTHGGRELSTVINRILDMPGFTLKLATRDFHPRNHVSFASAHKGAAPFTSQTVIPNPNNVTETQTTTLWPDHCVQGTPGCEIIPEINQTALDRVISKGTDARFESYSAFGPPFRNPRIGSTELDATLTAAGITHVFCVGLAYNVCVFHTAVDAAAHGYKTYVIAEGTTCKDKSETHLETIRKNLAEENVTVISVDSPELDFARQRSPK